MKACKTKFPTGVLLMISALFFHLAAHAEPVFVDTQWLSENQNRKDVVLIDMSGELQYSRFHIPGAISLDYSELVQRRKKDRVSVRLENSDLYKLLGSKGIKADHYLVIYDDFGGLNAGRLFWELERIGHKRMSVVNGGLVKWILEGRKVTNTPFTRNPGIYVAAGKGRNNETELNEVLQASKSEQVTLLDVRSRDEYLGFRGYPRTGHIPNARWWPWDETVNFEKAFLLKSSTELLDSLRKAGVGSAKQEILLYCQSGHRASQAYLTLRSLGYTNLKIYDGSMAEYSRIPDAPIRQGMQP